MADERAMIVMEPLYGIKIDGDLVDICQSLDSVDDSIRHHAQNRFRQLVNGNGSTVAFSMSVVNIEPLVGDTLVGPVGDEER